MGMAFAGPIPARGKHGGRDRPPARRLAESDTIGNSRLCRCCGDVPVDHRVLRGGAFNNNERNVRCAYRNRNNPNNRNNNIGFRVVVSTLFLSRQNGRVS
ncbi:MAG: SUMF1/EgtB/PvdO family nonheme iron enzyme [Chloroflexota bacterium]